MRWPAALQQSHRILDGLMLERINKGEAINVTKSEGLHLQNDRSQIHSSNFSVRKLWSRMQVSLIEQSVTNTWRDAAATTSSLIGTLA